MTAGEWIAPEFPPGFPRGERLLPLAHSAVRDVKRGAELRRRITRDPLLFALLYLTPYLKNETTGAISISEMHLRIYDRLTRWRAGTLDCSAWASHRTAGKTVKWFLEAPLHGAVHAGRDFCLMLSNVGDQVTPHLATLKAAIEDDRGLLLHDFPELRPGRPWTATDAVTRGGCRFLAAGMEKNILGARYREKRPKLIVGDDLEPGPADWTPASKAKTLSRLVNDVIPAASESAAIVLVGAPVGPGSLMHDVVRAARGRPGAGEDRGEWVRAQGFEPHYFPAILDAGTPRERSAWPTRWPLERLHAMRAASPRTFALQYMCDPDDPAAVQWWTEDTFRYNADPPAIVWRILSIDGAVTANRKSNETALVLLAVGSGGGAHQRVYVERAWSGRWSRPELRSHVLRLIEAYPKTARTVLVETNQAGDMWEEALTPLPAGVAIEPYRAEGGKRHRAESLYDDYARGAVWHTGRLTKLEAQMTAWKPGAEHDDLIDAVGAAVRRALYGTPGKAPTRTGRSVPSAREPVRARP